MKKILTVLSIVSVVLVSAQRDKLENYTAVNKITYKIGDTITLGKGSAPNGDFNYLQQGGFGNTIAMIGGSDMGVMSGSKDKGSYSSGIGRKYSGMNVIIKKIKVEKDRRGGSKVFFVVGGGNITNYNLFIDDAATSCEIKDCVKETMDVNIVNAAPAESKYDKLKKIKELKDEGILSEDEFQKEKEKIMTEK
ncbi:SHOCT domain-containing protein [Soonwooa sp.]|uniref:SHOCT domain-containing protein n=1 Tax=Soonwooa sp. TaxID=1938592 RepID=UPI0028A70256|nr:SHOCT domain-containing protein [Soonwooa sp.]